MPLRDALGQLQTRSLIDQLADAFAIAPAQADAVMRAVMPEFGWHLQTMTLSRGGLADLLETLGGDRQDGEAILARVLGTRAASRTLAGRAAGQCGVDANAIAAMLPHLAVVVIGGLALRANSDLAAILAQVPALGHLSRGSPQADLAGILRRRCGAGTYSPRALPRAVRRAIAGGGLPSRGIIVWYLRYMVGRRAGRLLRRIVLRSRSPVASALPAINLKRQQ